MSEENSTPEYIDPWPAEQRQLITKIESLGLGNLCDKKSSYPSINTDSTDYLSLMEKLKTDFKFDMLKSHTCVDWIEDEQFELITLLFSTNSLQHIWVSTKIPREKPITHSLSKLWAIAEFQEREVYDLFGVQYAGNSDLRRIFLDDDWEGFPLRKDYQDDFMLEKP